MINVHFLQLPCRVRGLTTKNEDDSFTIILNNRLSREQQCKSYEHELQHIANNDFDKVDVDLIEYLAHALG